MQVNFLTFNFFEISSVFNDPSTFTEFVSLGLAKDLATDPRAAK